MFEGQVRPLVCALGPLSSLVRQPGGSAGPEEAIRFKYGLVPSHNPSNEMAKFSLV